MEFEDLKYPFEITKTEIEPGLVIAHTDMGDGEPVVFIHGLGSYIPAWSKNLGELSRHFRCIALDLPGYGKSSKPSHDGTMEYYAKVIVKLMDNLGIETFSVCGHSMGGVIVLKLALDHSDRINKMVLVAPAGSETFTEDEKLLVNDYFSAERIISHEDSQIENNVLVNFNTFTEDARFMIDDRIAIRDAEGFREHAEVIFKSAKGVVDSDVPYRLSEITTPGLGFFAANDLLIPNRFIHPWLSVEDVVRKFNDSIPGFQTVLLDNCGHFVQFEHPGIFNDHVIRFFQISG